MQEAHLQAHILGSPNIVNNMNIDLFVAFDNPQHFAFFKFDIIIGSSRQITF